MSVAVITVPSMSVAVITCHYDEPMARWEPDSRGGSSRQPRRCRRARLREHDRGGDRRPGAGVDGTGRCSAFADRTAIPLRTVSTDHRQAQGALHAPGVDRAGPQHSAIATSRITSRPKAPMRCGDRQAAIDQVTSQQVARERAKASRRAAEGRPVRVRIGQPAVPVGVHRRLGTVAADGLGEDPVHVGLDRRLGHEASRRDLRVRQAGGDQRQDLGPRSVDPWGGAPHGAGGGLLRRLEQRRLGGGVEDRLPPGSRRARVVIRRPLTWNRTMAMRLMSMR